MPGRGSLTAFRQVGQGFGVMNRVSQTLTHVSTLMLASETDFEVIKCVVRPIVVAMMHLSAGR